MNPGPGRYNEINRTNDSGHYPLSQSYGGGKRFFDGERRVVKFESSARKNYSTLGISRPWAGVLPVGERLWSLRRKCLRFNRWHLLHSARTVQGYSQDQQNAFLISLIQLTKVTFQSYHSLVFSSVLSSITITPSSPPRSNSHSRWKTRFSHYRYHCCHC